MNQANTRTAAEEHVIKRLTYGSRPTDFEHVRKTGVKAFIHEQLHPEKIDDSEADTILGPLLDKYPLMSEAELMDLRDNEDNALKYVPFQKMRMATVARRLYSKKQLYEKQVQFWHEHFNVFIPKSNESFVLSTKYDQLIRDNTLGNFHDLLSGVSHHPCMLIYLDNDKSTNAGPNENFARELLELHTLGAMNYQTENGYTDDDVYEVSRCFTGWSLSSHKDNAKRGQFYYRHEKHDRFQKFVLGQKIARDQSPLKDGEQVLQILANHPGTARHIAWKLCVYWVGEQVSNQLVESTAQVFLKNKTSNEQIRLVLSHILNSEEFMQSADSKFRRPQEWLFAAMRFLDITVDLEEKEFIFHHSVEAMGQPLFKYPTPEGPSMENESWVDSNNLMWRWRLMNEIASGWHKKKGASFDAMEIMLEAGWETREYEEEKDGVNKTIKKRVSTLKTATEIAQFWGERFAGESLSQATMEAMKEFIADGRSYEMELPEAQINKKVQFLAALCCASPEFMRT